MILNISSSKQVTVSPDWFDNPAKPIHSVGGCDFLFDGERYTYIGRADWREVVKSLTNLDSISAEIYDILEEKEM